MHTFFYIDGPEYATLVFSSLPPSWTKSELEAYCESLGEDIEIESATEPEARNARVVLSGLTSEGNPYKGLSIYMDTLL